MGAYDSKLIEQHGMLYFVPPDGRNVPLFRLASDCGYRIDSICEELDVSPRHFRRLFQSLLGISPKSWLKAERMVFARNLLRGGHSIKEVSEKLGYSAQKEFYREFMQYYKVAPSEFRSRESERAMTQLGWAV